MRQDNARFYTLLWWLVQIQSLCASSRSPKVPCIHLLVLLVMMMVVYTCAIVHLGSLRSPKEFPLVINPRRSCAARVTVYTWFVSASVRLSVSLSVCLSVCHHIFCDYAQRDKKIAIPTGSSLQKTVVLLSTFFIFIFMLCLFRAFTGVCINQFLKRWFSYNCWVQKL